MTRRKALKLIVSTPIVMTVTGYSVPAQAIAPPVIVALAGVFISVAFRRYIVGPIIAFLARLFPTLFATELRRYLMAVAVAFGLAQARAALVAERAEASGAVDLAKDGRERVVDLEIHNTNDTPLELVRLRLHLVDAATNSIELTSDASWGLVVFPHCTMVRQVAATTFPRPGLKRWHLSDRGRTLAISQPFVVVT
jgi:hypothetical protein